MSIVKRSAKDAGDLVILERNEAIDLQFKIIDAWKPQSQVWPFKYSTAILSISTAASCMFINGHFRKKLRLFNYALVSSAIPTVVIPCITGALAHVSLIQQDILMRETKCSVCLELKAAAIQIAFSIGSPMLLAPFSGYAFASKYRTSLVPNIANSEGRRFLLQSLTNFTKPIVSKILIIAAAQGLLASFLALQEMKTVALIDTKFAELESKSEFQ